MHFYYLHPVAQNYFSGGESDEMCSGAMQPSFENY